MNIIDAHSHFGPGLQSTAPFGPLTQLSTADDLLAYLTKAGIQHAIAFAPRWQGGIFVDPDYRQANAVIADGFRKHPDRLIGFVRVNPKFGEAAATQVEEAARDGFQGLKLDPETEAFSPMDLELLGPLLEICQAHGMPVLIHTSFHPAEPLLWLEAAQAFPLVNFILGHMGYRIVSDAIIAAEHSPNIFLETSGQMPLTLEGAIKQMGAERIVFGTDTPFNAPDVEIKRLLAFELPEEDLERICYRNIMTLLPQGWNK